MKSVLGAIVLFILLSCGNSSANKDTSPTSSEKSALVANEARQGGIIGEWNQQYSYFDKNGNHQLDPEEKKPSDTRVGFDWFRFNADGSCLRDKEMKFKSTYEIKDKGNAKELIIQNVHAFTITELTDEELILGSEGAFIVFKKSNNH